MVSLRQMHIMNIPFAQGTLRILLEMSSKLFLSFFFNFPIHLSGHKVFLWGINLNFVNIQIWRQ